MGEVLTMSSISAADYRDRFAARTFTTGDIVLPYRLLTPSVRSAKEKLPLVVFLHGAGERGNDNEKQLIHGVTNFARDEILEKYPAFVFAPQCPAEQKWVDVDWGAKSHTLPKRPSPSLSAVRQAIEKLRREFSLDEARIFITGLSMGGYGAWDAISRWPELFAAAVPVCGGGDPALANNMRAVPVWAFHGSDDKAVPVERSREMIAALRAVGVEPKYTEYVGGGHDSWTQTYQNQDLYEWLFAQRK